ncbi:MAG: YCF48-related protein [Syntrophothermus sp.]
MKTISKLLIIFCLISVQVNCQWKKTNGLNGGVILSLAAAADDSGNVELFAGSSSVFHSTDNGKSWTEKRNGLPGSSIEAFASIGSDLFAALGNAGIYKSSDKGTNWIAMNTGLITPYVHSLFSFGNNLFAGTTTGVFLSTDKGESWSAVNNGLDNVFVLSFAASGRNIFAGTNKGIYITTDNGISWTERNTGLPKSPVVAITSIGNNLFAATGMQGIFLSSDNGDSWSGVSKDFDYNGILSMAVKGQDLLVGTYSGLYISTNNGTGWTAANSGMRDSTIFALCINKESIYAGTYNGIFESTDNGKTWTESNSGINNADVRSLAVSGTTIYAGTTNNLFLTTDNGANWRTPIAEMPSLDYDALLIKGDKIYAGTEAGGVFLSADKGYSWSALNTGIEGTSVLCLAAAGNSIYAGTEGRGSIFKLSEDGVSWNSSFNGGFSFLRVESLIFHRGNLYAGLYEHGIYMSSDSGKNWYKAVPDLSNSTVWSFASQGPNLYAGTDKGVFISKDDGVSWNSVDNGLENQLVYVLASNEKAIFAGTWNGVFMSTNNGNNWINISEGLPNKTVFTLALQNDIIYAGTFGDGVWKRPLNDIIAPNGQFIKANRNLRDVDSLMKQKEGRARIFSIQSDNVDTTGRSEKWSYWYLSQAVIHSMHILSSTAYMTQYDSLWSNFYMDGGMTMTENWIDSDSALAQAERSGGKNFRLSHPKCLLSAHLGQALVPNSQPKWHIKYTSADNASDSFGLFIDATDNSSGNSDNPQGHVPDHFQLAQNYPNPFNPATTISYSIPKESFVELKIFDMLGREISTLVNEEQTAGEYKVQFDGSSLPSGIYIYSIKAGEYISSRKMLLLK